MNISLNFVPVYQWTHREFDGVDPWAGNRPVRWSVVVYQILSETFANANPPAPQTVAAHSTAIPKKFVIGIFNGAHNRYRILPLALQDLWRAGQVRDQDLPGFLYQIEQPLRRTDYPGGMMRKMLLTYAILFGVIAAGLLTLNMASPHEAGNFQSLGGVTLSVLPVALLCFAGYMYWHRRRRQQAQLWLTALQQGRHSAATA